MARVRFPLPLDPTHRFTPDALQQLAEKIVGQAISTGSADGFASGSRIGTVIEARVEDGLVQCEADVDDAVADAVGGYGIDGKVSINSDRQVDRVASARVAAIVPSMLPSGARVWERRKP
jgi:hypothetical protein